MLLMLEMGVIKIFKKKAGRVEIAFKMLKTSRHPSHKRRDAPAANAQGDSHIAGDIGSDILCISRRLG